MVQGIGDAIGRLMATLMILCVIFVPLGAWKAIEIIIWLWKNVKVSIG